MATIGQSGRPLENTESTGIEIKGEYADNAAALAGDLEEGDVYSLPMTDGKALLAVVKPAPPAPVALRLKMATPEDIAQLPFHDAASFETWAKLGDSGITNPDVHVNSYEATGDTVTVYADDFTEFAMAEMIIYANSDLSPLIKEIQSGTITSFGNTSGTYNIMPNLSLLDLSAVTQFEPRFSEWDIPNSDLWEITIKVPSALSGNSDIVVAQDYNATVIFY